MTILLEAVVENSSAMNQSERRMSWRLGGALMVAILVCVMTVVAVRSHRRNQVIAELRNRRCLVMGDLYVIEVKSSSLDELNDVLSYMVANGVPGQIVIHDKTVSTETFRLLAKMNRLFSISLHYTNTTDEDIRLISSLPRLSTLALTGTDITDASLHVFSQMSVLRKVYLSYTSCTRQGVDDLRRARPDLSIQFLHPRE